MLTVADQRTCEGCGELFTPRRHDQCNCSRSCHTAARSARGRSEASKAWTRERDERRAQENYEAAHIIGIDGEGINTVTYIGEDDPLTDPDPRNFWDNHVYTYMSAHDEATGETTRLYDGGRRLRTNDMLWWLWKVTKKTEDGTPKRGWWFSSKYDWTGVFRDIIIEDIMSGELVTNGTLWQVLHADQFPDGTLRDPFEPVWWGNWGITYVQGTVTLYRRYWDRKTGEFKHAGQRHFADAFRCFGGGSFVSMLEAWDVGTPDERAEIARMKDERSHFTLITPEVMAYCDHEVELLAAAVKKITLVYSELGIRPRAWYSAGSAAKCLMAAHHVEEHRGADRYAGADERVQDIILRAYIGGWFENAETGLFDQLHSEDFKSAYPATIKTLPCLEHGHWENTYVPGAVNIGHVEWEPRHSRRLRWAPFPWRWPDGRIYRPSHGEGWYHEAEIRAAQKLADYDITEVEWVAFVPECDHRPFEWVQEVYDLRVEWGGDGRGLALKVTLNSVYGVTADTLSLDSRYASAIWAGMITAGTRARILELIATHGDQIVSVATDGILATAPVLGRKTKLLGELNYEGAITDVLLIQPGLYLAGEGPDPKKTIRNRGHALKDMRAIEAELRQQWELHGWSAQVEYKRTRFIPAKLALGRTDPLAVYGQWIEVPVTLKFRPSNREIIDDPGSHKRSEPSMRHHFKFGQDAALEDGARLVSAPYDRFVSMLHNADMIERRELENAQP